MNPWITIWTKPAKTIDSLTDTHWAGSFGFIPFILFGINSIGVRLILIPNLDLTYGIIFTIIAGFVLGILASIIWVNIIFLIGKIWKGQATRENIRLVLSLCLMPEIFRFINFIGSMIANRNNLNNVAINEVLTLVCVILGFRIIVIGLSRIQKYSFGLAILNIFIPQLIISVLYFSIKGL